MRLDTQQVAWLVLETLNRTQGKDTTVRLVVPRDPEVTHLLDPTLAAHKLPAAEAYLLERGYIAPTNLASRGAPTRLPPRGWSGSRRAGRTKRQRSMRPAGVRLRKSAAAWTALSKVHPRSPPQGRGRRLRSRVLRSPQKLPRHPRQHHRKRPNTRGLGRWYWTTSAERRGACSSLLYVCWV